MKRSISSHVAAVVVFGWSASALAQTPPPLPDAAEPAPAAPTVVVAEPVAPTQQDRPAAARPEDSGRPRYDLVRINAGFRVGYIPSRAFDSFASSDVLTQFSLDGTYPLFTSGKLVFGAGLGWDFGARSDQLRNIEASMASHRLYVPIEGRYHVLPGLAVFGKVSPGAAAVLSKVKDASAPGSEVSGTGWAFSADASVGASILVGPRQQMDKRAPRFWVTPEVGYAVTTGASVRPNPGRDDKDVLGSDEDTNLRTLALSGFFWRASVGVTF
jgi:hypothetical protein